MDLVAGVKTVYVITQHNTRNGDAKLVESCSYPLTGLGVVDRIYTDLAVIDVVDEGFQVVELEPGSELRVRAGTNGSRSLIPADAGTPGGAGS